MRCGTNTRRAGTCRRIWRASAATWTQYLRFDWQDAMVAPRTLAMRYCAARCRKQGVGIDAVTGRDRPTTCCPMPRRSRIRVARPSSPPAPPPWACWRQLAAAVASPQRGGLHAFNFVEDLSLQWLAATVRSGAAHGRASTAAAVRWPTCWHWARRGSTPSSASASTRRSPVCDSRARVFASAESHHSLRRACAVLGLGRDALVQIPCDAQGRMRIDALLECIDTAIRRCRWPLVGQPGHHQFRCHRSGRAAGGDRPRAPHVAASGWRLRPAGHPRPCGRAAVRRHRPRRIQSSWIRTSGWVRRWASAPPS